MKRVVSISLMLLMLGYAFIQIGVFIEYVVDIEAYTQKYCVNIDQPQKKCNGKCKLTKQLAENEEKQQKNDLRNSPEVLLYHILDGIELPEYVEHIQLKDSKFRYLDFYSEEPSISIFQPPQFIVI